MVSKNKPYKITRKTGQGNEIGVGSASTQSQAEKMAIAALHPHDYAVIVEKYGFEQITPGSSAWSPVSCSFIRRFDNKSTSVSVSYVDMQEREHIKYLLWEKAQAIKRGDRKGVNYWAKKLKKMGR
jgi:hypothetical protein